MKLIFEGWRKFLNEETKDKPYRTDKEAKEDVLGGIYTEEEELEEEKKKKDPCWKGYEQIGMKEKDGKEVPNCVPIKNEEIEEALNQEEMALDEAEMALDEDVFEEGGKCTKATKKTSSTRKGKKWMKCVKNPDGKGYVRRHWGQKGVRVGKKGSKRQKSFRARHGCKDAKPGTPKKLACDDW